MKKEKLFDIAYKYCDDIGNDDELEQVIKYMTWILNDRREQQKEIDKQKDNYKYANERGLIDNGK